MHSTLISVMFPGMILYECDNVNVLYDTFFDKFNILYNAHFPYKRVKINTARKYPWFNVQLKKLCIKKNKLYKKFIHRPNQYRERIYKTARNLANNAIRKAKQDYYKYRFSAVHSDLKATWKNINDVLKQKSNKAKSISFEIDGKLIEDAAQTSDIFNRYFVNVGKNISDSIPSVPLDPCSYLPDNYLNTLFFNPFSATEVLNMALNLKEGKSPGYD